MGKRGPKARPLADRFWEKVERPPGACWPYQGVINKDGYGQFEQTLSPGRKRSVKAHRVAYALGHGMELDAAPDVIDHACHNAAAEAGTCAGGVTCLHRRCCNPSHLVASTWRSNVLNSPLSPTGINARKDACPEHGPLRVLPNGKRECLPCRMERQRERRSKQ